MMMSSSSESTNHDDVENDDDDDDASSSSLSSNAKNLLGGSISTPAYALLVGLALENDSKILSIPLTSLPTTLGKEQDGKDNVKGFVGLTEYNSNDGEGGSSAANNNNNNNKSGGPKLSKSMCCIYYREGTEGGKLGFYTKKKKRASLAASSGAVVDSGGDNNNNNDAAAASDEKITIEGDVDALDGMTYVPCEKSPRDDNDDNNNDNKAAEVTDIIRLPSMQPSDPLPPTGFFVVECTGRKIIVGGTALKKGQHAMLSDGITLQIASHCFYFLLPKNNGNMRKKSIKVCITKKSFVKMADAGGSTATQQSNSNKKKKRDSDNDDNSDATDDDDDDDSSTLIKSPRPSKKSKLPSSINTHADNNNDSTFASTLESKTDTELLQMLSEATQSDGWDKNSQYIGTTLATRACRAAAASSSKLRKLNADVAGVTQRDVMNWINNESDTFGEYEKMMLRKIEPKSFGIAMGKAIIRAGYTKSDVRSGRANRWALPSDIVVPPVATVEHPTMKKSPSTTQMKLLPTGGGSGGNKLPQKPIMTLPKASSNKVMEEMEKEVGDKGGETVSKIDKAGKLEVSNNNNDSGGGDGSGGAGEGDTTSKEESNKSASAILPSPEDLKVCVEAWLARPENARVSETLLPNAKQKDEIIKECGVDKKRLEGYFYRLRKKLKQKQHEAAGATASTTKPEAAKTAVESAAAAAAAAAPTPTDASVATTTMTQQEHENIAASRAFNEAIQKGSPFKVASEEALAAAAANANQNLPQPVSAAIQQVGGTTMSAEKIEADQSDMI
ncbi:hypothetical protein ACHAXM_004295 [Skeletonema potamos]